MLPLNEFLARSFGNHSLLDRHDRLRMFYYLSFRPAKVCEAFFFALVSPPLFLLMWREWRPQNTPMGRWAFVAFFY
jgi:hypothetical protein